MLAYGHDVIAEMAHRDAMVASGLVTVNPDTGEEWLGFETDDYVVEIEYFDWHRGLIPLPKGVIYLKDAAVHRAAKLAGVSRCKYVKVVLDDWGWFFDDGFEFGSAYIEFLYPGSPGYGLNVRYHELISSDWDRAEGDREYWVDRYLELMGREFSSDSEAYRRAVAWIENPHNRKKFLDFVYKVDVVLYRACEEIESRASSYLDWETRLMEQYAEEYEVEFFED